MNRLALTLALAATLAGTAACSQSDPAALVASAKDYIGKREFSAATIQLKNALQEDPRNAEARYLLGLASLESGDLISAEVELGKAQELGLRSDELQVALARTLLGRGSGERLLAEFGATTLASPAAQAELKALLGMAELGAGPAKREQAEKAFREALRADPGNVTATLGLARLAALQGEAAAALRQVEQALAAAPGSLDARLLKADLLATDKDEAAAAEQAYREAIGIAPHQAGVRLSLVGHLLRQGALDKAQAEVEAMQGAAPRDPRTHYARAMLLMERRDFSAAREAILQVLKVAPEHVPSLTLAGLAALRTGAYAEAESHLRKAVAKEPQASGAQRALVTARLRLGQSELALKDAQALLARPDPDPGVLALAAEASLANGDIPAASRYYEKAKSLAPKNAAVQTRLAQLRFAAGDSERGFKELRAASSLDAEDYQADLALISAHLRRRESDKALEAVKRLEEKQPRNPLTHNLRGLALVQKRDFAGARKSFERAVALQPAYMPAVANLARLDLRDKNPAAARKRYEAVLAKEPNNEQAALGLAVVLRVEGAKPPEVEKLLKRAVAANPASVNARAALINHHLRNRDAKAALAAAQEANAALPGNPAITQLLGTTQLAAGEPRQAISTFQRLAEMTPKSPQPHLLLARAHLSEKNADEAIRALRAALALQPDLPAAHRDIAAIYVATQRVPEALREAREMQKQHPDRPLGYALEGEIELAQKNLGNAERIYRAAAARFDQPLLAMRAHAVMAAAGKRAEANAFAEDWIKRHPRDTTVLGYLGDVEIAAKDYASAVKRYRRALERQPDNARLLNNLAWAGAQLKRPDALEHAERAHELRPEDPAIMDTLGWILTQQGEQERGLELLARAVELAPEAPGIRLNFAKALLAAGRKQPARAELEALAKLDAKHPVQQEAAALLSGL